MRCHSILLRSLIITLCLQQVLLRSFLLKNSKHFKCFSVQRFPIRSLSSNVLVNNDDFGGRGVVQRLKLNNPKKRFK
ncbi:hypothetical protein DERF_005105 [Dermatophagoides farinae]|uniref:Secreted protein n=1 Tax=Dermatophagoides farinae TaxID=6954 RepID=A0A922I662_DERFA|nr:hypothetical protein DERF_005105 [Dermatophagoides farinae]